MQFAPMQIFACQIAQILFWSFTEKLKYFDHKISVFSIFATMFGGPSGPLGGPTGLPGRFAGSPLLQPAQPQCSDSIEKAPKKLTQFAHFYTTRCANFVLEFYGKTEIF